MCMTTGLNVTPKTTEQHLIVCSDKSKAEVTKQCARGTVLLKQTSDRHETSRGLSATAELRVLQPQSGVMKDAHCGQSATVIRSFTLHASDSGRNVRRNYNKLRIKEFQTPQTLFSSCCPTVIELEQDKKN